LKLFSPRKTFFARRIYRSTRDSRIQTSAKNFLLLETTHRAEQKHLHARSIFLVARQNLCYQLSVTHEFSHEAFQHYLSRYKFFRLLEYTASYF